MIGFALELHQNIIENSCTVGRPFIQALVNQAITQGLMHNLLSEKYSMKNTQ